ncbi:MAG TPA: PepSY domain-containing protein [Beijerinckiaceae bacterium]|nr:PepSY domain-containing protein [Beijerinckiaceae bacterium]
MTKHLFLNRAAVAVTALGFAALGAMPAFAYPGQAMAKHAKVTMAQARKTALRTYPGKITSAELEKEKGGSGLRYSFDIKGSRVTHEVGVDAKSGKVLENSLEGKNAD